MSEDKSKPFEIRLALLHLAKDTLAENMHMKVKIANDLHQPLKESPGFTTEDIIKEAEKLNSFVNNTGVRR